MGWAKYSHPAPPQLIHSAVASHPFKTKATPCPLLLRQQLLWSCCVVSHSLLTLRAAPAQAHHPRPAPLSLPLLRGLFSQSRWGINSSPPRHSRPEPVGTGCVRLGAAPAAPRGEHPAALRPAQRPHPCFCKPFPVRNAKASSLVSVALIQKLEQIFEHVGKGKENT